LIFRKNKKEKQGGNRKNERINYSIGFIGKGKGN